MTVTVSPPAPTAPWLVRPGTSAPTGPSASSAQRFVVASLIAGAMLGTVASATPADAADLRAAAATARTVPAGSSTPGLEPTVDTRSVPNLLRRLRDSADLTWGDLARAMTVSRRTIHNWLSGAQLSRHHLSRLLELELLVETVGAGTAATTGIHLKTLGPHGRSALDDFALESSAVRSVPLSTVSAADLLEPDVSGTSFAEMPSPPARRSSLRGGPLRGRRSEPV